MIISGIGQAGKNIANLFKPHTGIYKILIFDENDGIEPRESVEEYDEHPVKIPSKMLEDEDEAIVFVCGSGKVAGCSLRVLEALSGLETTVFYIAPDLEFCSREERLRHRVHFNVLQEYARSGKIKNIMLISNKSLISTIGSGPVTKYYEKVNFYIYSLVQNLMYCLHTKPEFGQIQEPKSISRISTIGVGYLEKEEEILLYPLDNITETCYLYNIDEEDLDNDETLLPRIQDRVRDNKSKERETSYAIWKASEDNVFYSIHYTHYIQEDK